jgi:hypothetical protein
VLPEADGWKRPSSCRLDRSSGTFTATCASHQVYVHRSERGPRLHRSYSMPTRPRRWLRMTQASPSCTRHNTTISTLALRLVRYSLLRARTRVRTRSGLTARIPHEGTPTKTRFERVQVTHWIPPAALFMMPAFATPQECSTPPAPPRIQIYAWNRLLPDVTAHSREKSCARIRQGLTDP